MKTKKNYYAGHLFSFTQHFLDATPKNYSKPVSFTLACCIHHICRYKKTHQITLEKKYLETFGLKRRHIRKYLNTFSKAGLLTHTTKQGSSPTITLLLPLQYTRKETKNKLINYISCKHVSNDTSTCVKCPMSHVSNDTSEKFSKKQDNPPTQQDNQDNQARQPSKATKQGNQDNQVRQGRGRTKIENQSIEVVINDV